MSFWHSSVKQGVNTCNYTFLVTCEYALLFRLSNAEGYNVDKNTKNVHKNYTARVRLCLLGGSKVLFVLTGWALLLLFFWKCFSFPFMFQYYMVQNAIHTYTFLM